MSWKTSPRVRNACEVEDYKELLKMHVTSWSSAYKSAEITYVIEVYEEFLLALMAKTPRVSLVYLKAAAFHVFRKTVNECQLFANVITEAVKLVRVKAAVTTSGKRQSPSMLRCINVYRKHHMHLKGHQLLAEVGEEVEDVDQDGAVVQTSSSSGSSSMSSGLTWGQFNNRFSPRAAGNDEDSPPVSKVGLQEVASLHNMHACMPCLQACTAPLLSHPPCMHCPQL